MAFFRNFRAPLLRLLGASTSAQTVRHVRLQPCMCVGAKNLRSQRDERDFLLQQNDPDTFGSLSPAAKDIEPDADDLKEQEYTENRTFKKHQLTVQQYATMIKQHLKNKQLKEALDVLEIKMLKDDRVQPNYYIYNLLIAGCAHAGYTKKAFQLFNRMKERGLNVSGGTYSSLFNACANSPWPNDGLERANRLRELMIEKNYEPNTTNYNAMIKAYGRCGDIKTAFQLVDEMRSKNITVTEYTINFMLQACASDKELGFRHALLVWHKMYRYQMRPDLYTFNTLIRCIRDCGMGDVEETERVIKQIIDEANVNNERQPKALPKLGTPELIVQDSEEMVRVPIIKEETETLDETPNLLTSKPYLGSLVSISEVKNPNDRLLLLGGFKNFMAEMERYHVMPDLKTFTALLEVIPPTVVAEKRLLAEVRRYGIKCDIDFFNILMKKRSLRLDFEGARKVLTMIKTARLSPDIATYGVLAMSCHTEVQAREFLAKMEEDRVRPNVIILGAMIRNGCISMNIPYVAELIRICRELKIAPSEILLENLRVFAGRLSKLAKQGFKEKKDREIRGDIKAFKKEMNDYYEEFGIRGLPYEEALRKIKEHPYEQFKSAQSEGYEEVKNTRLRQKRKEKHRITNVDFDEKEEENPKQNAVE